ncbi:MAG: hypothetical protein ACTHZD_15350 [Micrococcaceae bacterium]
MRHAREHAATQARLTVGLVYAHVLQDALVDVHSGRDLANALTALLPIQASAAARLD